jgi:hypothetical protein
MTLMVDGVSVALESTIQTQNIAEDHFQVTTDGKIVIHDIVSLYTFSSEGALELNIPMPENYLINTFCFVPLYRVYAISAINRIDSNQNRTFFL